MTRRLFVLLVCFGMAGAWQWRAGTAEARIPRPSFATFPLAIDQWRGRQQPPLDDRTLAVLGMEDYLTRIYTEDRWTADLYIGYWGSQRQGDTIHSPLNCLPGSGWEPVSKRALQIPVADAPDGTPTRPITINRYVVEKGLDRQLVLYWYQSHGRVVASEYASKLYLIRDAIRLHRTDAALVRVMVRIADGPDGDRRAEEIGVRFITAMFPRLSGYLPS